MKSILLILVLILTMSNLDAQTLYTPNAVTKGKNASYYCMEHMPNRTIRVRNIQNKDTLADMYYNDGKVVPMDRMLESSRNFEFSEFVQTFKDAFTPPELNQLKTAKGSFIVNVVADKAGNTLEMDFIFRKHDPVLSKFTPDRLFQLETKLKKLLKLKIGGDDCNIKNVKYMVIVDFERDLN